jgi:hypothetical protein
MNNKKTDIIDEALRLGYLAHGDSFSDERIDKEFLRVSAEVSNTEMNSDQENLLLSKLLELMNTESLGQSIAHQLAELKMTVDELAKNNQLPVEVVQALVLDDIYTNNIPIQIFRKMMEQLKLNVSDVERSIRKTLQLLAEKTHAKELSLQPTFRKGFYHSRGTSSQANKRTDGRELYENSESMEKYINRLKELMS